MSVSYEEMIEMATDKRDQKFIAMLKKVNERLGGEKGFRESPVSAEEVNIAMAEINNVMTALHYRKMDVALESVK